MIIGTIVDGIVIDHIPAGRGMDLYKELGLDKLECEVAVIKNASSGKYGKKDILKINEVIDLNYDMLGYIDPHITVNIIRGGERMEKIHPHLPETIVGAMDSVGSMNTPLAMLVLGLLFRWMGMGK